MTTTNPLEISSYARSRCVELIMAVFGRSQPHPKQYRQWLEGLTEAELDRVYKEKVEEL